MSNWPIEIDGREFHPIPDSWIEHGDDHHQGEPRLYAVSVAHIGRGRIAVRYHHPTSPKAIRVTMQAVETPIDGDDGLVPALLTRDDGSWPRSIIPTPRAEPGDVRRGLEREHLRTLWGDRLEAVEPEVIEA